MTPEELAKAVTAPAETPDPSSVLDNPTPDLQPAGGPIDTMGIGASTAPGIESSTTNENAPQDLGP